MSSSHVEAPVATYRAEGAIGQYIRVKLGTTPQQVEVAGAEDDFIGTARVAVADGELIGVIDWKTPGTRICVCAGTVAAGAVMYGVADGEVDDAGVTELGVATHAAVDQDYVEIKRTSGQE